jgi:hypothetical protein
MLKSRLEVLAKRLGHNIRIFQATDASLSRWKCRLGIKCKKAYGQKGGADFCKAWTMEIHNAAKLASEILAR